MKTAFLETSAINKCLDNKINAKRLKEILKWHPVIGNYTTYELARTFKGDPDKTKQLFCFIKELDPIFTCSRIKLYQQEVERIKTDSIVNHLIEPSKLCALKMRIDDYCKGHFNQQDFIDERQTNLEENRSNWSPNSLKARINPNKMTFAKFVIDFFNNLICTDEIKKVITLTTGKDICHSDILKFKGNMDAYPALRTLIYSHLYLNYVAVIGGGVTPPSEDKLTDQIQLAEASYCTVFVSGDDKHLKYACKINPNIELLAFKLLLDKHKAANANNILVLV